jgi:hypothetical protein
VKDRGTTSYTTPLESRNTVALPISIGIHIRTLIMEVCIWKRVIDGARVDQSNDYFTGRACLYDVPRFFQCAVRSVW